MMKEAYPLQWPIGWKRTQTPKRSAFGQYTIDYTIILLLDEIRRLNKIRNTSQQPECVISTNLKLRKDGLPYSDQRQPADQGVAVYFKYNKKDIVIACDSYTRIQDNIYAISKTIECMRAIERYGASDLIQRAFTGFQAMLMPAQRNWWDVLECKEDSDLQVVKGQYRHLVKKYHPDNPGTGNRFKFDEIQFAWENCPHYPKPVTT